MKIQKQIQYNRAHINFQPSHSRRGTEVDEELDDELVEELVEELDEERKAACKKISPHKTYQPLNEHAKHAQINRSTANKVFTFEDNCSNTPLYP